MFRLQLAKTEPHKCTAGSSWRIQNCLEEYHMILRINKPINYLVSRASRKAFQNVTSSVIVSMPLSEGLNMFT